MSTVLNATAFQSTTGSASSKALTIPATTAGSDLVTMGFYPSASGTRTFNGGGGTWGQIFDDTLARAIWRNKLVAAGTTSINIANGGVNTHFTGIVLEIAGLDQSAAAVLATGGQNAQSPAPAGVWTSNNITIADISFVFGYCTEGTNQTFLSDTPVGWVGLNCPNNSEGDVVFAFWKDSGPSTFNASSVWKVAGTPTAVNCAMMTVAFKNVPAAAGIDEGIDF